MGRGTDCDPTLNVGAEGDLSPDVSTGRIVTWMSEFPLAADRGMQREL